MRQKQQKKLFLFALTTSVEQTHRLNAFGKEHDLDVDVYDRMIPRDYIISNVQSIADVNADGILLDDSDLTDNEIDLISAILSANNTRFYLVSRGLNPVN